MTACSKNKIKAEFDFSNYAVKSNVKNAATVGRWIFTKKVDSIGLKSDIDKPDIDQSEKVPSGLNSLKSKVDKLDIGKLETTPVYLSKLSDLVKNDVVTRTEYDELVKMVIVFKTTDTSNLVKKADCDTKIGEIEKKILDPEHDKYITTQECNKLTADNLAARLK